MSAVPGLARPFTLLAPMLGTGAGAVVAVGAGAAAWSWTPVLCAFASAAFATAASNAWNQAFDADIDRVNKPSRPIPRGAATERQAIAFGHLCAVLALILGYLASIPFLACVATGIIGTWIYSAPPMRTKRHLVGALLTIAVPRGLLVPVAGWSVLAAPTAADPWALGAVTFLFVLGAAATKDFADVEGDEAHGCRTLPVALGAARAARFVAPFLVAPFLLYVPMAAAGLMDLSLVRAGVLAGVLAVGGLVTARALLADPAELTERGGNHPAWIGMYLLMLGAHVGAALAYAL